MDAQTDSKTLQFATVTVFQDNAEDVTLRVPLEKDITVRQLAKKVIGRLRIRSGVNNQLPDKFHVVGIFVKSESGRAEIFSCDMVTQVVKVNEEVIFMQLQAKDEGKDGNVDPERHIASSTEEIYSAGGTHRGEQQRAKVCDRLNDESYSGYSDKRATTRRSGAAPVVKGKRNAESVCSGSDDAVERRNCRMRSEKSSKVVAKKPSGALEAEKNLSSRKDTNTRGGKATRSIREEVTKKQVVRGSDGKKLPGTGSASKETREERARRRRGDDVATIPEMKTYLYWGPEASKNFAPNFTNSPDKIGRILRKAKQSTRADKEVDEAGNRRSGTVQTTVLSNDMEEPRTFPAAVNGSRAKANADDTQGKCADNPIDVERQLLFDVDEVPQTPLNQCIRSSTEATGDRDAEHRAHPRKECESWGKVAYDYFDPETYCDNPAKAKLSPAALSMPLCTRSAHLSSQRVMEQPLTEN
ncbi:unnamed protein product [Trypanosoma congolense IL3000]|uniref:WGS project CAEQ00000000 data, annotated contig 2113 n=1 Tax=Trypanosoma congolense (strain IL3000) TaxID=1068625 RepID=F9WBJ8_TRYCI|nr:unnamed protein product [Trypanosoma congolense IL3000]